MTVPSPARGLARRTVLITAALTASLLTGASTSEAAPAGGPGTVESRNTATVRAAYNSFFGEGRTDQYGRFFAKDLIQHDPAIAGGQAGLVSYVRAQRATTPRPVVTIKRILADGPFVALHTHVSATPADEATGRATIELYRLNGDRIVEHWALTQDVPATTASGNTMFSNVYRYPGTAPTVTPAGEDRHKQLILKAWAAVYSTRDFTVLDRYWAAGTGYLQHNPRVPNGTAGLKGFLGSQPPSVSQNRFALADGDLVLTINQSVATTADLAGDAVGSAVGDIYRVVDDVVVEHWDVIQTVPATSANGNSMFSELYGRR